MISLLRPPLQARSQSLNLYQPKAGDGCVLWLPGQDDAYSATIRDRSGYGNDGTIIGAPWEKLPSGLWALHLDGSDDEIDCGTTETHNPTPISFCVWVKADTFGNAYNGVEAKEVTNGHTLMVKSTGKLAIYFTGMSSGGTYDGTGALTLVVDTWYFLAYTYDEENLRCYANLVIDKTVATTGTIPAAPAPQYIGQSGFASREWDGYVVLPRFFSKALSLSELTGIRNQERHLFGV